MKEEICVSQWVRNYTKKSSVYSHWGRNYTEEMFCLFTLSTQLHGRIVLCILIGYATIRKKCFAYSHRVRNYMKKEICVSHWVRNYTVEEFCVFTMGTQLYEEKFCVFTLGTQLYGRNVLCVRLEYEAILNNVRAFPVSMQVYRRKVLCAQRDLRYSDFFPSFVENLVYKFLMMM
jgi:hypothetical protein